MASRPTLPGRFLLAAWLLACPARSTEPGEEGQTAEPPTPVQVARQAQGDYVIGPGDLMEVDIFELEELSKTVRVAGDGSISYPMLGTVQVGGLTRRQLEAKLTLLLEEKYVKDPQVTVLVKEMQSGKISVLGAVSKPGGFALVGAKSVLDLLSEAGGITKDAGNRAYLVRAGSNDPTEIDLRRLMEQADLRLNLPVGPGDVLYVPKSRPIRVFVYGQVEQPGVFEVDEGERVTVLQAVSMAGGLSRRGSGGSTKIVRGGQGGTKRVLKIDLDKIIAGKQPDVLLLNGDIVVVPKSFF